MKDRLKFRVWHKKRKQMYEVLHLHTETWSNGGEWVTAKGFNIITQQDIHIQIEPKDGVIMQCMGLKDKNGKLIYEGDIVKNNQNSLYSVEFEKFEHQTKFCLRYGRTCMSISRRYRLHFLTADRPERFWRELSEMSTLLRKC